MKAGAKSCVDPGFYSSNDAASTPEEARLVLVSKMIEHELSTDLEGRLRNHIKSCTFCAELLSRLQEPQQQVAYAVCPSSEALNRYLFDRDAMPAAQLQQLTAHIAECPLCREETDWLRNLESSKVVSFRSVGSRSFHWISIAAALFFLALASVLWWRQTQISQPEQQLRALASVKEPHQIDFDSLNVSTSPLDAPATRQYKEALELFKSHEYSRSANLFHAVLEEHPEHSASLFLLGYSYYKLNQAEKAFELCQRSERIRPHSYERCMTLVHLALKTGHFDRAVMEINALYHEAPDHPEIRRMYSAIHSITKGRTLKM